MDISK